MPGRALLRLPQLLHTLTLRRVISLVAIVAVVSGVAVLDAAADPFDFSEAEDDEPAVAVTAHDLLASSAPGEADLAGALAPGLRTPRGLSPQDPPMVDPDELDLGGDEFRVDEAIWDALAECESNQRWDINTGNGFYGGLQFTLQSWEAVGGTGYPHQHPREVQIRKAERLLEIQGWGAWPACSRQLGLR